MLGLLVLVLGLGNFARAGLAMRYAARLPDLPMTVTWACLVAAGLFWGLVLTVCAAGLVRFRPWGRWATMAAVAAYEAHVWIDRLLFDASDYARQTRPQGLVLAVVFLVFVWGLLNWPSIREEF